MDESIRELIHRAIDHEADAAEVERLQDVLASDPAARAEWEEVEALDRMFAQVGLVEPPTEWKVALVERLREQAPHTRPAAGRSRSGWRIETAVQALRRRLAVRSALVFAAGAAAAVTVFAVLGRLPLGVEEGSAPGSLIASRRLQPQSTGRPFATLHLDLAGGRIVASTSMQDGLSRVEIEADCRDPLALELDFDSGALRVRGVEQEAPVGAAIDVGAGRVRIEQRASNRYWLTLEPGEPGSGEIRIRVQGPAGTRQGTLPAWPAGHGS